MLAETDTSCGQSPKLRSACENCRQSKVKCNVSGNDMCIRCQRHGLQCRYGYANRSGKPKGSKNRATLQRMGQLPGIGKRQAELGHANYASPSMGGGNKVRRHLRPSTRILTSQKLEPKPGRLSESPSSFQSTVATDTPQSTDPSSLGSSSMLDPNASPGLGYPSDTTSPTFTPKEALTEEMAEFPLAVHIPYTLAPACECVAMQACQMNDLGADTSPRRFDQSLQSIKATLCACRTFLRCTHCAKDSASLLLSVSALDLALQESEGWIALKPDENIRYGEYEMDADEILHVGGILVRGLLLQCREALRAIRETLDARVGRDGYGSSVYGEDVPGFIDPVSGGYLQQIIQGHETTVVRCLGRLDVL
ncbi:finger domain protein [Aspergillus sp. HF37]|nr:finger domain protein [Aspergillus sp. HF37]